MKHLSALIALFLPLLLMATERSASEAAILAAEFMNEQYAQSPARKASCSASSFVLAHTRAKLNSEAPAFYVFNKSDKAGYVIVSADDRTEDILVYAAEGQLDMDNINPNFRFWLNRLQEEISAANDDNTYTAAEKKARKAVMVTAISPLLVNKAGEEIAWDQEEPYWNQCPMDLFYTSERCLTGCVATATAQIMYKWRYPAKGTGSKTYTWVECKSYDYYSQECTNSKSKELSKDFSTVTFDWDNMLATYKGVTSSDAQKAAVATLMYCCGVASEMEYGGNTIGGSGAWTDVMADGLVNYFGYKAQKFITTYTKAKYGTAAFSPASYNVPTDTFKAYFNADLEAGRPILMGGEDSDGGHEFVCDGRDSNGKFHINWGWSGDCNNYCTLTSLKPSGSSYNFSSNIDALIGLQPAVVDTVHVTGISVAPTTLTLKIKEKSTLTATVAPANATDKSFSWSSSDNSIATVSDKGVVTGVAKGNVTISAITKDGNKKATCNVIVTEEIIETTDCDEYNYEFKSKCATGSNTLGAYTWNISLTAGAIGNIDTQNGRGQQFGSKNTPAETVSLTTSNVSECLVNKIKINAAMGKDGDAQLAVYINGTEIGTANLTSTAAEYTFDNTDNVQGNLEIRLTNTKKAMYIKSINVNPADEPTDLDDQLTDSPVHPFTKFIINGQLYIQSGENLYNAQGQLVR